MAIHYDPKLKRFRDDSGKMVSKDRALRSSIARREYEAAQRKKPKLKALPKQKVSPAKPKVKLKAKLKARLPAKPAPRIPPWEREGIVREYPEPDEWLPEVDFYGYDDLIDDWGDYDDEETDS